MIVVPSTNNQLQFFSNMGLAIIKKHMVFKLTLHGRQHILSRAESFHYNAHQAIHSMMPI